MKKTENKIKNVKYMVWKKQKGTSISHEDHYTKNQELFKTNMDSILWKVVRSVAQETTIRNVELDYDVQDILLSQKHAGNNSHEMFFEF